MWQQVTDPFHQLAISAGVAAIPILALFVLLITKKVPGHVAAMCTLLLGLLVATVAYGMPVKLAVLSTLYGMVNGVFPIGWVLVAALFLYNLSVKNGGFAIVCRSIEAITPDRRLQALLIAFCFGAFLEGCAGFGAPVAITTGMLVGLGFRPLYAAGVCLLANSAPVAFGSIGIPVITAGQIAKVDPALIGRMIAHQLPLLSFLLPFWLVVLIAGWRGARSVWPAALVVAASYSLTLYLVATFLGPLLPDILAALVSLICLVLFLRVWRPATIWRFPQEPEYTIPEGVRPPSSQERLRAWTPYLLLILFVGNWGVTGIKANLDRVTRPITIVGLDSVIHAGSKTLPVVYNFGWLSAAGTAILCSALLTAFLLRTPRREVGDVARDTLRGLRYPLVTLTSIVGFAYLANYSGMSLALGSALTVTGHGFPFLAPLIGWLGVFVSGSDTASNALFSNMQKAAATHLGLNPILMLAANTDGGVTAKMISPQSIAVAAASSHLTGQEGQLFRKALPHSLALVGLVCVMTYLQAYHLPGMVPPLPATALAATTPSMTLSGGSWAILSLSLGILLVLAYVHRVRYAPKPHNPMS